MDRQLSMAVFKRAVDTGSFAATARRFAISPEMAGNHVRGLEKLGISVDPGRWFDSLGGTSTRKAVVMSRGMVKPPLSPWISRRIKI